MPPRAWKILSAIVLLPFLVSPSAAADGPECFSKYTKMNICEYARGAHAEMVNVLPMKLSNNVTIVTAVVVGPRLVMGASFQMTKAAAEALATERGITMTAWADKIAEATTNSVCGDKQLSAFVRLGGQVQYVYKTLDGFPIFQPAVTSC